MAVRSELLQKRDEFWCEVHSLLVLVLDLVLMLILMLLMLLMLCVTASCSRCVVCVRLCVGSCLVGRLCRVALALLPHVDTPSE